MTQTISIPHIQKCRGCNTLVNDKTWVLEMKPTPLVGKLFPKLELAKNESVLPLTWISCVSCGLLQVLEDVPDRDIYSVYNYASSSFQGLQSHFGDFAELLNAELDARSNPTFVEIGCNDGILIRSISKQATKFGVDPSDIAAKSCDGSYVLKSDFFSDEMMQPFDTASVDIVTTSNSFAHFTNISGAIKEIERILKPDGLLFVEVHDGDLLLDDLQWDTIYHEHKVEWTEAAATRCFQKFGLYLEKVQKLPMHGGTIRLLFSKKANNLKTDTGDNLATLERFRSGFDARFDNDAFQVLKDAPSFSCYGASGRAVNWIYQMGLEDKVTCFYDDSSERVGRFVGHTGIEVRNGDRVGETDELVVITAWNFADAIRAKHAEKGVNWIQYY